MDPFSASPAPTFSSTDEFPHAGSRTEHNAASLQARQPAAATPHSSIFTSSGNHAGSIPSPARPPDAFAVSDTSADPLLAGLQLAQERLAFHLAQSADNSIYHGGAVTSLMLPLEPPPPPPLHRDVVDSAEALPAAVRTGTAFGQDDMKVPTSEQRKGDELENHHGEHDGKGEGKRTKKMRRHVSRRQHEHARRVEVALNPALVIEKSARAPSVQAQSDVIVLASSSSSSSSRYRSAGSSCSASPDLERDTNGSPSNKQQRHRSQGESVAIENQERKRKRWQQKRKTIAHRKPSTAKLDAHLRKHPPAGNDALAVEVQEIQQESDVIGDDNNDYRPDDENASQLLEERMQILQHSVAESNMDDDTTQSLMKGYAAYVRPAEHFQRGPIPLWMQHYSNWLLFDKHRLDTADAKTWKSALRRDMGDGEANDAAIGVGGIKWSRGCTSSCCGHVRVQLPVDAVVLRLRGDVARARRLRAQLLQGRTITRVFFPDTYADRYEVYNPAEPDWVSVTAELIAASATMDNTSLRDSTNAVVEMQAAVQSPKLEVQTDGGPAMNTDNKTSGTLHAEATEVVVDTDDHPTVADVGKNGKRRRSSTTPLHTPPSQKQHTPLMLSRELEAQDLQRPLLTQTIPPWRRRGAAVKFLSELISFLEDRLHAFGKQLDDPVLGPSLELIGAPDSSGVDGTVQNTLPPALERAMRTTITNTLMSDLFATQRSALNSRALRISEALRRRQTPYVHDVYVTQLDCRPVYDYTAVSTARSKSYRYGASTNLGVECGSSGNLHSSLSSVSGVDTRKSYSIHVDYVRFQPSLQNSALSLLQKGIRFRNAQQQPASGTGSHTSTSATTSRRPTLISGSTEETFSSLLLGSYINVFFPTEKPNPDVSSIDPAVEAHTHNPKSSHGSESGKNQQSSHRGSLGTDNIDTTTTALLLAISTATIQNTLVTFSPEEYLISLLLRYYEQYRMLQLNLLPALKNRFFYQEQLTQLQRQPRRNTELNKLQARLESLAETSANVERGCLHVMIMLWNTVLEHRRRQRRAVLNARYQQQQQTSEEGINITSYMPGAAAKRTRQTQNQKEPGVEEEEDPPIIIEHRTSVVQQQRGSSSNHDTGTRSLRNPQPREVRSAPPPPMIPQELRAHPPVFADEEKKHQQQQGEGLTPTPVVHSVNNTVTYNEGDKSDIAVERKKKYRGQYHSSSATTSGSNNTGDGSPQLPLPLFFSPNSPDARTASAIASPLLTPPPVISSSKPQNTNNNINSSCGDYAFDQASGEDLTAGPQLTNAPPAATRFRFFLRRYGTTEEVPYTMGDDLLWYAAEVEGTDVIPMPTRMVASRQRNLSSNTVANVNFNASDAAIMMPHVGTDDELLYFQLVVFTRSNAAMVPQYVGCTAPRPMTTAKVIFFNETFEVRAMHEPAELLLHLIPVTAGPSKMTVVSTVRLRPTLTRRYALLPLQPPIAFMFQGKLFTRNNNSKAAGKALALAAAPLSGVLAASTTWTSSQGLTVAQMEQIFLGNSSGGGGGADPLDPQYQPLLRALCSYYTELELTRAANAQKNSGEDRERSKSRGRRERRGAAVRDLSSRHSNENKKGVLLTNPAGSSSDHLAKRSDSEAAQRPHLGRHASSLALLRQRHASASRQHQLTTLGPGAFFNTAAPRNASVRIPGVDAFANRNEVRRGTAMTGGMSVVGTEGGGGDQASLNMPAHLTPMMVFAVAAGAHDYAVEEVQLRLPTARLQYLFRRWLVKMGRIKPADEIESLLLKRPIPLEDTDVYLARKRVLRLVEKDDETRKKEYSAFGAQFDAERYYKAPSAISGLALSNLPRETKLKLWQERQRRLLLTLKPGRHVSDAEKLEMIVKVPKLAATKVFDLTPRSQLNPHRKERPRTEDIDRALLKRRQDSRIVIHIMKAHNLPYRADGTPLETFVQASFVSEAAYTRSEVGSSPSWFQTLELPFQPLDFEEDTLSMIDDDIVISLYDKVEVKMAPSAETTAAVAHETHYRTERRFIGTLRIPFYSLHQASEARIEGVYPLRTPRWLLGYDLLGPSEDVNSMNNTNNNATHTNSSGAVVPTTMIDGAAPEINNNSATYYNSYESNAATTGEWTSRENPLGAVKYIDGGNGHNGQATGLSTSTFTSPAAAAAVVRATAAVATTNGFQEQHTSEPTIQLYLSLWPPLQRDPPKKLSTADLSRSVSELYVSPQLHYLHRVALQWQQSALKRVKSIAAMNAQATTRQIDPFVECSTGDLVLVCRYMLPRGGPPPPSVRTVYEAIRYVSLLPFVADMMSFGEKDVWNTNAELLAMRSGDYEELALLLVHFLRHLAPGRPTYAVVGSGSVYQQTILVLHEFEDRELYLIDPRSGWTVPVGKPYGTMLRDVYMVISHDQLWANVQMSGLPHRMTWDLYNPAHWLPCFDSTKDRRIPACIPHLIPIQREMLEYPPADAVKSREIEIELRACLKRALLTWRNGCPPAYHRGVEAILRELLEAAEEERCTCGSARRIDITRRAAARLSEYFGEPVTGDSGEFDALQRESSQQKKQQQERRKRHHSRHQSAAAAAREDNGAGKVDEKANHDSSNGSRNSAWPLTSSAALRVLGSPVMGTYNPADPQFEEVLQQVFEGAVHEVGTNEVSFAAGIYVKSYTGDVCAMWIFFVAICRG